MESSRKKIFKYKKGFTLAELMIVIVIISIMSSVSLVMFYKNRSQKEVETAARVISSTISQTYNNAIAGKMYNVGGSDRTACWYGVRWANGGLGMKSFASYIAPGNTSCTQPNPETEAVTNLQGVRVDTSATLSGVNGDWSVKFALPFGNPFVSGFSGSAGVGQFDMIGPAKIRVYSARDNSVASAVCVFPSGRVYEKGCTNSDCSDVTCN